VGGDGKAIPTSPHLKVNLQGYRECRRLHDVEMGDGHLMVRSRMKQPSLTMRLNET
jgi:hypothetical protein